MKKRSFCENIFRSGSFCAEFQGSNLSVFSHNFAQNFAGADCGRPAVTHVRQRCTCTAADAPWHQYERALRRPAATRAPPASIKPYPPLLRPLVSAAWRFASLSVPVAGAAAESEVRVRRREGGGGDDGLPAAAPPA